MSLSVALHLCLRWKTTSVLFPPPPPVSFPTSSVCVFPPHFHFCWTHTHTQPKRLFLAAWMWLLDGAPRFQSRKTPTFRSKRSGGVIAGVQGNSTVYENAPSHLRASIWLMFSMNLVRYEATIEIMPKQKKAPKPNKSFSCWYDVNVISCLTWVILLHAYHILQCWHKNLNAAFILLSAYLQSSVTTISSLDGKTPLWWLMSSVHRNDCLLVNWWQRSARVQSEQRLLNTGNICSPSVSDKIWNKNVPNCLKTY